MAHECDSLKRDRMQLMALEKFVRLNRAEAVVYYDHRVPTASTPQVVANPPCSTEPLGLAGSLAGQLTRRT